MKWFLAFFILCRMIGIVVTCLYGSRININRRSLHYPIRRVLPKSSLRTAWTNIWNSSQENVEKDKVLEKPLARQWEYSVFSLYSKSKSRLSSGKIYSVLCGKMNIAIYHGKYKMSPSCSTLPSQNTILSWNCQFSTASTRFIAACFR